MPPKVFPTEADVTESDNEPVNGVQGVLLELIDQVENLHMWLTNDEQSTIDDRNPLPVPATAFIAATTSKVDVHITKWNKACLTEHDAMNETK